MSERMRIDASGNLSMTPTGPLPYHAKTGFEKVDTEMLRNLWMVKFGKRAISMRELYDAREEDINMVAQELFHRGAVYQEVFHRPDEATVQTFYVLKKEESDGDH